MGETIHSLFVIYICVQIRAIMAKGSVYKHIYMGFKQLKIEKKLDWVG